MENKDENYDHHNGFPKEKRRRKEFVGPRHQQRIINEEVERQLATGAYDGLFSDEDSTEDEIKEVDQAISIIGETHQSSGNINSFIRIN